MASAITYQGDVKRSANADSKLFDGQKLWFSQGVPSRKWLMDNAQLNGAQILPLEKQADIKLVDHAKKNQAPGTHSYKYVELSIRNGQLEDLDIHRVGSVSRVDRPVGSVITASKGGRTKFTNEDDQILWNWIKPYMDEGGAWKGLEIYKQLETRYPSHPYQSWRDRWIRYTQFQNRRITEQIDPAQVLEESEEQLDDNARSPKRRRIDHSRQIEPQRANVKIAQQKHSGPPPRQLSSQEMGNAQSLSQQISTSSKSRASQEPIYNQRFSPTDKLNPESARDVITKFADSNERSEMTTRSAKLVQNVDGSQNEAQADTQTEAEESEGSVPANSDQLPLAFNFTQEEARSLYRAVPHILDTDPANLDKSWSNVAKEVGRGHKVETWQRYFWDVILPEYKLRNNITTDAELEAHYLAEIQQIVKKQRQSERMKGLQAKNLAAQQRAVTASQQTSQGEASTVNTSSVSPVSKVKTLTRSAVSTADHDDALLSPSVPEELHQHQQQWARQPRSLPSPVLGACSPRPNESRKLSHSRTSQSTSSQPLSQSTSRSMSQPLQPPLSIGQRVLQSPPQSRIQPGDTSKQSISPKRPHEESVQLRGKRQKLQLGESDDQILSQTPSTGQSETYSHRFVTQVSNEGRTMSTGSTSNVDDIPFQAPSPLLNPGESESSLSVPRGIQPSSGESSDLLGNDAVEAVSSPPVVQLLEDDDIVSQDGPMSDYAPSETTSEGVQFESEVGLSQAWETAPNELQLEDDEDVEDETALPNHQDLGSEKTAADLSDGEEYNILDTAESDAESDADNKREELQSHEGTSTQHSSLDDYETAPTMQQDTKVHPARIVGSDSRHRTVDQRKLDTQALFRQFDDANLAELVALPELSDDEDDTTDVEHMEDISNSHARPQEADWTLPLPDPDLNDNNDTTKRDDDTDIDSWLAAQPKTYETIPPIILTRLSHRALESASMDLELADAILARMIQRYEKGKYPVHLSIASIGKLSKRERKSKISKLAEELLPNDMAGCWTVEDDNALRGVNGRMVKIVSDKHGEESMRVRFEFLEMWHS